MTIWKYSRRDAVPLFVTAAQMALNIWLAATWDERPPLQLLLLGPVATLLLWYNGLVATHNFLHTPWFEHEPANRAYAAINSINVGVPLTLCRLHHWNHHRFGNDRKREAGCTRDHSSTYAFGRNGQPENVLTYCALGLFRGGIVQAYGEVKRKGRRGHFWLELGACVLGLGGYLVLSWKYFLFFFVPVFYAGSFVSILTNYYQHIGASGEDRRSNSVSHYGRLYNVLFCNEGYHQEHHLHPQVHWTQRPALRDRLPDAGRTVSILPPPLRFLER